MSALRLNGTWNRVVKQDIEVLPNGTTVTARVEPPGSHPREQLRVQARWIRDVLDPQVARDGQDALHSDDLLTMDELLRKLLESDLDRHDILYSRMHLAISMVAGLATRWPRKLIEKCDILREVWSGRFGQLQDILLYEPGGRLHGICKPEDLNKENLVVEWLKTPGGGLSPTVARRVGHLGFEPGDWWISPLFAHRDGIIDRGSSEGGIVCDGEAAYAVVMVGGDEITAPDGVTIQYRTRGRDPGRYRLSAATIESRHPIRILRSHNLNSLWRPRAGLRYEGLYNVTGWSIKHNARTNEADFVVDFKRLPAQAAFETVLERPWTEEVEDYREYKRIRDTEHRLHSRSKEKLDMRPATPQLLPVVDGVSDLGGIDIDRGQRDDQTTSTSISTSEDERMHDAQSNRRDSFQVETGFSLQHSEQWARQAYWNRRTSSALSVQTASDRRATPSEAEVATQLIKAAWHHR